MPTWLKYVHVCVFVCARHHMREWTSQRKDTHTHICRDRLLPWKHHCPLDHFQPLSQKQTGEEEVVKAGRALGWQRPAVLINVRATLLKSASRYRLTRFASWTSLKGRRNTNEVSLKEQLTRKWHFWHYLLTLVSFQACVVACNAYKYGTTTFFGLVEISIVSARLQ